MRRSLWAGVLMVVVLPLGCGSTKSGPAAPAAPVHENSGIVTTMAGSGSATAVNDVGILASFYAPQGVAVDSLGNVYVADYDNQLIRKITPGGAVTTLAGSAGVTGAVNATGTSALFNQPTGVAVDAFGNVYVADSNNNMIRKITPGGAVTTLAGQLTGGATNAIGTLASFNNPTGVAVDSSGNVYVGDEGNSLVRKITPGGAVTTLAGGGPGVATNATGTSASFSGPNGIAVDSPGNVYVADSDNYLIRKITPGGMVTTVAGTVGVSGSTNATGTSASFNIPAGVAVDGSGNLYIADRNNNMIREISPGGVVKTLAGQLTPGSTNATGTSASFNFPIGIAVDSDGSVYVGDYGGNLIRKIE